MEDGLEGAVSSMDVFQCYTLEDPSGMLPDDNDGFHLFLRDRAIAVATETSSDWPGDTALLQWPSTHISSVSIDHRFGSCESSSEFMSLVRIEITCPVQRYVFETIDAGAIVRTWRQQVPVTPLATMTNSRIVV